MVLVAHYDLQLHQKDVKTHSSTRICMETFTWHNSKDFVVEGKERKGMLPKEIHLCSFPSTTKPFELCHVNVSI